MNVYPFLVMLLCCVPTARIHDSVVIVNNLLAAETNGGIIPENSRCFVKPNRPTEFQEDFIYKVRKAALPRSHAATS